MSLLRFIYNCFFGYVSIRGLSGISVLPRMHRRDYLSIGKGTRIERWASIYTQGGSIKIGRKCHVSKMCIIHGLGGVEIGDNTLMGPGVHVYSSNHNVHGMHHGKLKEEIGKPVRIGSNVWLGAGVIVLPGVLIGDNCVIAAGAIVAKNVMNNIVNLNACTQC